MKSEILFPAIPEEIPTVSVIIPTYNRAHLLGRAVKSVLSQTYQDFELILIDDGSTDHTREIIEGFNEKRITYIKHPWNKGVSAARNTGVRHAKGKYVALQDSDDEWLPNKLERQIALLEKAKQETGVVYTEMWRIKDKRKKLIPGRSIKRKDGAVHKQLLKKCFIGAPTTFVLMECFKKIGMFDEDLCRFSDWDMWIRISEHYEFAYLDTPLVISYYQPDSISLDMNKGAKASQVFLEKHHDKFLKDKRLHGKRLYWAGNFSCHNGDMKRGRRFFLGSLRLYPLNIKCLAAFVIALLRKRAYYIAVRLKRSVL